MAKGAKTGGDNWQQGKSGNPNGRPKLPKEVREIRKLTAEQIITVFSKYLGMTECQMQLLNKENLSLLELWLLKVTQTGMKTGNYFTLDKMLDRVVGKTLTGVKVETESNSVSEERLKEILNILNNPRKVEDIKDLSKT